MQEFYLIPCICFFILILSKMLFTTICNDDSLDWKNPTPKEIIERVTTKVKPGSIVLFHNGAKNTPTALPAIIENLQGQGYTIVPISQLIYTESYTIDNAGMQIKG